MLQIMKKNLTELLILAQNGDNIAYSQFLTDSSILLRRVTSKWIKNAEIREEIIQETLLGVHQNIHTFQNNLKAEPWLSTIARYKTIDYLRKNRHQFQELTEAVTNSLINTNSSSKEDNVLNDYQDLLRVELKKLDPLSQLIIEKTKIEQKSTRQTAIELGIKENAVRTRISRGIQKLKDNILGKEK